MFMITPKSIATDVVKKSSQVPQSTNRTTPRAARVQKACDRCRLRKIKCNGDHPCLRCAQDKVLCAHSNRKPGDPKSITREYIASLEQRQLDLVKAFQQVFEHIGQPIGEDKMQKISATLEAQGINPEHFFIHVRDNAESAMDENPPMPYFENTSTSHDPMNIPTGDADESTEKGGIEGAETHHCTDMIEYTSASSKQPIRIDSESVDDYWGMNDSWNQMPSSNRELDEQAAAVLPFYMVDQNFLSTSHTSQQLAGSLDMCWDAMLDPILNMDEFELCTT